MTAQTIPVPFHGHTLYLIPFNDEPYVPMRPIVEGMGLDWKTQHRKLVSSERLSVVEMTTDTATLGTRQSLCIPVRKLPGWLMTIHPRKVKPELKERILAYQNECDDVLWRYWKARMHPAEPSPLLPPETTAFARLDAGVMRELRLINSRLVQAYLVAHGVTPAYIGGLLAQGPVALIEDQPHPAPVAVLRERLAAARFVDDTDHWYLTRAEFEGLCVGYDVRVTAQWLRDIGAIATDAGRLTHKAPARLFRGKRPNVFALVKAAILEEAAHV